MSLNGLLLIDKPSGCTSHDVVHQVRKLLNIKSVGHAGTLDPLATGLLVLLLGEATKISNFILSENKTYRVKFKVGEFTTTLDSDGEVLQREPVSIDQGQFSKVILGTSGDLELEIPIYSAKKVNGQKLYEKARSGEKVELPKKLMKFFDIKLIELGCDHAIAEVSCTKGSFIRSWVNQIGQKVSVGGTIYELRRLESSPYSISNAMTLEQLNSIVSKEETSPIEDLLESSYVPLPQALPGMTAITIQGRDEKLLRNGQIPHEVDRRLIYEKKRATKSECVETIRIMSGETGHLISIVEAIPRSGLKLKRVFNS